MGSFLKTAVCKAGIFQRKTKFEYDASFKIKQLNKKKNINPEEFVMFIFLVEVQCGRNAGA